MKMMTTTKILIGNDHGGYDLKLALIKYLQDEGYAVEDVGSHSDEMVRYPYYAAKVAGTVSKYSDCRGILICSTGIGMSIIANKFKGVRAALCSSSYQGRMTSAHNNSNVLCLGGRRSEEHTSELQSLMRISYAVFCLKKTQRQSH